MLAAALVSVTAFSPLGEAPQKQLSPRDVFHFSSNDASILPEQSNGWSFQTADFSELVELPLPPPLDNCSSVVFLHSILFVSSGTSQSDASVNGVALIVLIGLGVIGLSVTLGLFALCSSQKWQLTEAALAFGTVAFLVALVVIVRRQPRHADSCRLHLLHRDRSLCRVVSQTPSMLSASGSRLADSALLCAEPRSHPGAEPHAQLAARVAVARIACSCRSHANRALLCFFSPTAVLISLGVVVVALVRTRRGRTGASKRIAQARTSPPPPPPPPPAPPVRARADAHTQAPAAFVYQTHMHMPHPLPLTDVYALAAVGRVLRVSLHQQLASGHKCPRFPHRRHALTRVVVRDFLRHPARHVGVVARAGTCDVGLHLRRLRGARGPPLRVSTTQLWPCGSLGVGHACCCAPSAHFARIMRSAGLPLLAVGRSPLALLRTRLAPCAFAALSLSRRALLLAFSCAAPRGHCALPSALVAFSICWGMQSSRPGCSTPSSQVSTVTRHT